jgi:uncharacterized protein (TIGR00255 family)
MLRSMTGFGVAEVAGPGYKLTAELRSVNHRFLDIALRLPRALQIFEDEIKSRLRDRIDRGRLSLAFTFEAQPGLEDIQLNEPLVNAYARAGMEVAARLGLEAGFARDPAAAGPLIAAILAQPEVLNRAVKNLDEETLRSSIFECIDSVVAQANEMKEREGRTLGEDLGRRIALIAASLEHVRELAPRVPQEAKVALEARLRKLLDGGDVDPQRLAQETALVADRSDITEECVRLASHLSQFRDTMRSKEQGARRLGFLLQEMHREVNTIGSKTAQLEITHEVLRMKEEIEKLREQVQNLE